MSFVPNFPPSLLQRIKSDDTGDEKKRSKDDYRKMKELEEARKLAVMPAMKDEDGRDINPHIPQYIMQAPWYYGALHPTLRHQRIQDEKKREETSGKMKGSNALNVWYKRGVPQVKQKVTFYRDGACENCGSMSHKRKDCLERPRKIGAKYTGLDIAGDECEQITLDLDYEGKRDRWNGYDPSEHKRIFEEYQRLEEARKIAKAKKLEEKLAKATEGSGGQEEPAASAAKPSLDEDGDFDAEDGDRYGDELDMPGQKFDSKQRQSIRNLRIREDTAKYLFNLDPNSAYYDSKTRAMRGNPFENSGKPESEVPFAGDNFVRYDGEVQGMIDRQVFAWEMHDKLGLDVHLQADPTRLELLAKKVSKAKCDVQNKVRAEILERYGGHEHLEAIPKELILGQWESYAEYSPTGRMIRGAEKPTVKSRYEEDVFNNNHTSVWGSYWFNGQWGYRCCHSLIKESYCLGDKSKETSFPEVPDGPTAVALLKPPPIPTNADDSFDNEASSEERTKTEILKHKKRKHVKSKSSRSSSSSSSSSSSDSSEEIVDRADENDQHQDTVTEKAYSRFESDDDIDKHPANAKSREDKNKELARSEARRERIRIQRADKKKKRKGLKKSSKNKHKRKRSSSSSAKSEENMEEIQERLIQEAIRKERERLKAVDAYLATDERKRPYNSLAEVKPPTAEEMEAYYRTKINHDDPMSHFM
ncbi:Pre-mRNA-splicing factor SLU7 [Schistosoma japonicum]|uniref:Pre-mRNA-splicing factor SLU7 n=1 Tax=Schistosoma japonicum TaxID=6182 RepID=A0A4Z2D5M0_SCHJA|nr:Pre-mRNA-splicing factor SLU7 [Schistosoma japonicum]TNN11771.1 Pre-mRNA-splicing factor SLU7 [Schistosoma japonicum]TNN11772.1 Pre-mRNA-splicing factor SLU7 [Schistosoma japonicum]